jgi:septal ring factor EnvC (AmiA/AmiB activator)
MGLDQRDEMSGEVLVNSFCKSSGLANRARRLVLVLSLLFSCQASLLANTDTPTVTDLQTHQRELSDLQTRIESIRSDLRQGEAERDLLSRELRQAEERVAVTSADAREAEAAIEQVVDRMRVLNEQRLARQAEAKEQQKALAGQLRNAYVLGSQQRLKLFLSQEDPGRIGRLLGYHDYLSRSRVERIQSVTRNLELLRQLELELEQQRVAAAALRETKAHHLRQQEQALSERRQALAAMNAELRSSGSELQRLEENERSLQVLVKQLQEALAALEQARQRQQFADRKGQLLWPVDGDIAAKFGSRRPAGDLRWRGLLIDATEGQPVRAVHAGRVVFSDWLRGFGLLLILDHGDDYLSVYAHNQALYRQTGQEVVAGEVIAAVGNSGGQERSGLYFEIRHRGQAIDPIQWLVQG